jgi:hypothetical protein
MDVAQHNSTKELRDRYVGDFCKAAGRDWNPFDDYGQAEALFTAAGFGVTRDTQHRWAPNLSLPVPEEMRESLRQSQLWVMTPM